MALLTSACDLDRLSDAEAMRVSDPVLRHPVGVEARRASIDLMAPSQGPDAMAGAYLDALRFIRQYRRDSRGPLTIVTPHGHGRAQRLAEAVRHLAVQNGVPPRAIRHQHRSDGLGTVTLFYDSVVAVGPECGDWSEDVNRSPQLKPAPIFGCASRRNLAHMVAEPTDLLIPQSETPRQSDRRTTTYKEYVTHKPEAGGGAGGQKSGP